MKLSLLFGVCILIRFVLAYFVSRFYDSKLRYFFVVLFFTISMGLIINYVTKIRTSGAFGQEIWWDAYRPIHAFMYALTSIMLLFKYKYSYIPITFDTTIGVYGYINK